MSALRNCPFCGSAPFIRTGLNAYGHCKTDGCYANRAQTVALEDPTQVSAWNRRATPTAEGGERDWAADEAELEGPFETHSPSVGEPGYRAPYVSTGHVKSISPDSGVPAALARLRACVNSLEGVHGFPDDKPVDTRHFGPLPTGEHFNDFAPLTWGDLRALAAPVPPTGQEGWRPYNIGQRVRFRSDQRTGVICNVSYGVAMDDADGKPVDPEMAEFCQSDDGDLAATTAGEV